MTKEEKMKTLEQRIKQLERQIKVTEQFIHDSYKTLLNGLNI